jgi:hypothetical protein
MLSSVSFSNSQCGVASPWTDHEASRRNEFLGGGGVTRFGSCDKLSMPHAARKHRSLAFVTYFPR